MPDSSSTIEEIRTRLTSPPSKALTLTLAQEAMGDDAILSALLHLIYHDTSPVRWRAAWVIEKVSGRYPSSVSPEVSRLTELAMCPDIAHGLRRLLLRIIYNVPDRANMDVAFFNFLLDTMLDPQATPGVQSLAMKLASRISACDRDLHDEFLCLVGNMELEYYSKGVCSVARECLKKRNRKV